MSARIRCAIRTASPAGIRARCCSSRICLPLHVGEHALHHEPSGGQRTFAAKVGVGALPVGGEQRDAVGGESFAQPRPQRPLSAITTSVGGPVSRSAGGSYSFSFAGTSVYPSGSRRSSVSRTARRPEEAVLRGTGYSGAKTYAATTRASRSVISSSRFEGTLSGSPSSSPCGSLRTRPPHPHIRPLADPRDAAKRRTYGAENRC